jgi:nitrogen fixation/metabolism regulation signal transduction histidine kinase
MKQELKKCVQAVVDAAERYRSLPDKIIDTNFLFLVQMIIGLLLGVAVLYLKALVAHTCIVPILNL